MKKNLLFFLPVCFLIFAHLLYADLDQDRADMVKLQIEARGIQNGSVLQAMRNVKRHEFVPPELQSLAYADQPLPIGEDQTISQPYIVALMTELLELRPSDRVLEIGTGSGYQAAVLAEIVKDVYTIEIIPKLAERSKEKLLGLGYKNIHVITGDGTLGLPQEAPFDAIIVTAAPEKIPEPLTDELKTGGRMIIPLGKSPNQTLYLVKKTETGLEKEEIIPVRFVPMTSPASENSRKS